MVKGEFLVRKSPSWVGKMGEGNEGMREMGSCKKGRGRDGEDRGGG